MVNKMDINYNIMDFGYQTIVYNINKTKKGIKKLKIFCGYI